MARSLNRLQVEIIRVASAWVARNCYETVENGGNCIDEVHRLYGRTAREAYCTKFAWVVIEMATSALKMKNPLPKTAQACNLLTSSVAKRLRVDKIPGIGSVFYRSNAIKNSSGHVGIVIDVTADSIRTVEGNNDDRVDDWLYPLARVRQHPRLKPCQRGIGWDFIHVEDAGGAATVVANEDLLTSQAPSLGAIVLSLGTLVGAYFATKAITN